MIRLLLTALLISSFFTKNLTRNDASSMIDLLIPNDMLITDTFVDKNNILSFTIKSESSYFLCNPTIEYYDGKIYKTVKKIKSMEETGRVLKGGVPLEFSIDLDEYFCMNRSGSYRIIIFLHSIEEDRNKLVFQNFNFTV